MAEPMKIFGIPIGGGSGDSDLKEKLSPKNWSLGTQVLAILFVIGIGWTYWQVKQVKPLEADEDAELSLVKFDVGLNSMKRQMDPEKSGQKQFEALKDQVEINVIECQIPAEEITRDPFARPKLQTPELTTQPTSSPASTPDDTDVTEPEEKAPPTDGLKLDLILAPNAIISGMLVKPGQTIQGWTVDKILPDQVILKWKDKTFKLQLDARLK